MRVRLIWLFVKLRKFLKVTIQSMVQIPFPTNHGFDDTNQFDPFLLFDNLGPIIRPIIFQEFPGMTIEELKLSLICWTENFS